MSDFGFQPNAPDDPIGPDSDIETQEPQLPYSAANGYEVPFVPLPYDPYGAAAVETTRAEMAEAVLAAEISELTPNVYIPSATPEYFGYLGWGSDPASASDFGVPLQVVGVVYLTRMRCIIGGTCGHLTYGIQGVWEDPTSGQNFVGIYDTGQTTAGVATLLGSSIDQTINFHVNGVYTVGMQPPVPMEAGQDYFLAVLANSTGSTGVLAGSAGDTALINAGLSGLALRTADALGPYTALPATIPEASLDQSDASGLFAIIAMNN